MAQAVTELVVRGDGALAVLDQFERGMEDAGAATDRTTGAVADFERRMAMARDAIERGNAVTTQSVERKTAEQRAWDRWSGTVDRAQRLRIQLEREAARAAVDAANAVNLGYTSQEQALSTLIALEQRHAAQMQAVTDQTQRVAQSAQAAVAANDNLARSMGRVTASAEAGSFQTANIAAQFQDIGVTAAMGMNPIMIALQQGTQLSAVLNTMQNPLRGLAMAFVSIINPVSLLTIGFVALTAASIQFFTASNDNAKKAETALEAHDKWLDEILVGYKNVREAARLAGEEAQKLPQAEVQLELDTDAAARQSAYADALAKVREQILATNTNQQTLTSLWLEGGDAALEQRDALLAIQSAAMAANPNLDQLALSLKRFNQDNPDSVLRNIAEAMLENVLAARSAEGAWRKANAAARELRGNSDPRQFMPGVADAIDEITRKTVDLRTEQERLDQQFRNAAAGARTIGELNALVAAYENMQRAAQASAWAVKNSGDAAVVAAGQYGTATGAANAYANALWALGNMIPQVAAAQAAMVEMRQAEEKHTLATEAAGDLLRLGAINRAEYNERIADTTQRLEQAKDAISGVTALEEQLATQTAQNSIDALSGREQALARVKLQYADQAKAIEEARARGASQADIDRLLTQNTVELERALANTNAQFDQTAAKSGGAAKALKAAERDFNSFISTADKLAEALFPGEYARREAMELQAALDMYGSGLDDLQRRAVEAEIGDLFKAAELGVRRLEDQTKTSARNMGEELQNTLGSILGDLFSKPIEDFDDFIDRVMSGLGQLGQANLSASMDMLFGGGDGLSKAVERGAKAGTEAGSAGGIFEGLASIFGGSGQSGGMMGVLGSAAGGLGIGYQTQDPMMGALGGALSGIAGGPLGMIAGALGGFIGGIMGANKALQEAQEKLAKVRGEIETFIDVGEGRGVGEMTKAFRDYWDQSHEYQELARKAGDDALLKRIQEATNSFFIFLHRDFELGYSGIIEALHSGEGLNGAFGSAQQSMLSTRDELKAFVADVEYMNAKFRELNSFDDAEGTARNVEEARKAAQAYALSVLSGVDALTDYEKKAAEANGKASALQVTLEQLGMSAEDAATAISVALGMAMAKLRDEYARDINASINDLSGFGFINEIVEAQAKYQERLRDAAALGLDGASALQELSLSLAGIARSAGLTQSQIDMLAQTFPAMAGMLEALAGEDTRRMVADAEAALRSAYEAQRREIEQTISRLERFAQSIRKFRDEMRLSDSSPLGQRDQTEEALRQFRETAALAAAGDVEAQNRLTNVSQAALDEARAYYASSARYSEIWTEIDRTLADIESKTGRQLTDAQRQMEALDKQVGALITLNASVLSVADAIANLAAAQKASDLALAAQLAQLGGTNSNAINEVYKSVLGREAEAGGLTYWNNQMNQGKTVGQITDQISNSREMQVQRLYQSILGRAADTEGLKYWVGSNKAISQIEEELRYMKSMGSYATGGFTGYGGVNDPAGIVHRGEYVFDAASVSRIGLQNLEAMRAGRAGNDNGDVVAELRALRSENVAIKGELARIASVIALDGQETRKVIAEGNDSTEELASSIKRVVAA